jgi:hypothetical protein
VAQGVGPEFKLQSTKIKKTKDNKCDENVEKREPLHNRQHAFAEKH